MPTFTAYRRGMTLVPDCRAAELEMDRLPHGARLRVHAAKPRSPKHHRASWAFFALLASALNHGAAAAEWRPEDVKAVLLVATGHSRETEVAGRLALIPVSTAYDAMDGPSYVAWLDAAMIYVRKHWQPAIEDAPEWPDIVQFLAWVEGRE